MSSRKRILAAAIVILVGTWTIRRITELDVRVFFIPSASGATGFVRYLLGDFEGSANAYLTHYQNLDKLFPNDGETQGFSNTNPKHPKPIPEDVAQNKLTTI